MSNPAASYTPPAAVTVYSSPGCMRCHVTKKALAKLRIPHTEVDVTADSAAADYVRGLGYQELPVVVAGGTHWSGHRDDNLNALAYLNRTGGPR